MVDCKFCLEFTRWMTKPEWERLEYRGLKWKPETTCQLCQMIFNNLQPPVLEDFSLDLQGFRDSSSITSEQDLICACALNFRCEDDEDWRERMRFAVWADKGSHSSKAFITRPPIFIESLENVCDITHYWLNNCNSNHVGCSTTEETQLPTRVLRVSGSSKASSVKLMETNGMKGRYCALSHCWGAVDKQPLSTTRENLQQHLKGISLEELPKSFQDTVMLAKGIGIEFVWIDSLCIVQNDNLDWHSAATDMGIIYSNAALVIAAAGSRNSTEGLFITERPQSVIVKVPYVVDHNVSCSFNISLLPRPENRPSLGPLRERAWAFQEWYLAQRLLFFMPGGITWRCKQLELDEQGYNLDLSLYERLSWINLLLEYTDKQLTYPSDRLHALRGVATEMQKTRQDQFLFKYGVWEDQLWEQLLWRSAEKDSEANLLDLPTWSWAATGGKKLWCPFYYKGAFQYMPTEHKITSLGSLNTAGYTITSTLAPTCVPYQAYRKFDLYTLEKSILPGLINDEDYPSYLIRDDSSEENILGIAVFDEDPISQATIFFVALTERYSEKYPETSSRSEDLLDYSEPSKSSEINEALGTPDYNHESYEFNHGKYLGSSKTSSSANGIEARPDIGTMEDELSEAGNVNNSDSEHEGEIDTSRFIKSLSFEEDSQILKTDDPNSQYDGDLSGDSDMNEDYIVSELVRLSGTSRYVYWALLLKTVGQKKFKRVGLAMLYPHAYNMSSKKFAELEIV